MALSSAHVSLPCQVNVFTTILERCNLPGPSEIVYAAAIAPGGSSFDPSPPFPTNATDLPGLCAVKVQVQSSQSSAYNFGIFLPSEWNSRLMTTGNGGFSGGINYLDMGVFSHYGFASVSTDTGHLSTNGSWALNDPESMINWGWRAMHGSVDLAKQIVTAYYADSIQYSYYAGCSTGGRQGLKEIQRFPEDFDGILVGAPAWWTNHLQTWTTWIAQQNLPETEPKHVSGPQYAEIVKEAKAQCDSQDSVSDGIVQNPDACNFDYQRLLCSTENTNTTTCLTQLQLETLKRLYNPYIAEGNFVFPGFTLGSDPSMLTLMANSLGYGFLQWFVYNDTSYSYVNFSYADVQAADRVNPGEATADHFDISAFKNRGGKVIMYHGWEDSAIPTGSTPYYYHATESAMPGSELDDFYRLFLIPGMGHCARSEVAPWYIAGASQNGGVKNVDYSVPGYMDAEHDAVLALMRWVEESKAPEYIIATKFDNDSAPVVARQRPLCVYPKVAVYKGSGGIDEAGSWIC